MFVKAGEMNGNIFSVMVSVVTVTQEKGLGGVVNGYVL